MGANSAEFKGQFISMIALHKSAMVALLETKMTDHHKLTQDLGFDFTI